MPARFSVPLDTELNIDSFSQGIEEAMPSGYQVSRNPNRNSLSVSDGPFATATVKIQHNEDKQTTRVDCYARQSLRGAGRSLAFELLILVVSPVFLIYQFFVVGPKVRDLDETISYYVPTRLREMGYKPEGDQISGLY